MHFTNSGSFNFEIFSLVNWRSSKPLAVSEHVFPFVASLSANFIFTFNHRFARATNILAVIHRTCVPPVDDQQPTPKRVKVQEETHWRCATPYSALRALRQTKNRHLNGLRSSNVIAVYFVQVDITKWCSFGQIVQRPGPNVSVDNLQKHLTTEMERHVLWRRKCLPPHLMGLVEHIYIIIIFNLLMR